MKQVITARDIEELVKSGAGASAIPADAIITPAAQDLIAGMQANSPGASTPSKASSAAPPATSWSPTPPPPTTEPAPAPGPPWVDPRGDLEAYFNTAENWNRKEQIVDVGRRLWAREYVDGNGGNISLRVGENLALCTPTLVSKGFMKPQDICMVDLDGNQKAGVKPRTSEILMHLEIMKAVPRAVACVHCHPPYATAFAASGVKPPNNILPEFEVFIGDVPIAGYDTPGTIDMARKVATLSNEHNTILMANHGVVAWSHVSVEDAYFKMEILEAYCRTIMVTTQLGKVPNRFTPHQMKDLLNIKQTLGVPDPRIGKDISEIALEDDAQWRPGVTCIASEQPACSCGTNNGSESRYDEDAEEVVKRVTDMLMERLG